MFSIIRFFLSLRFLLTLAVIYFLFGGPLKDILSDFTGTNLQGTGIESDVSNVTSDLADKTKDVIGEDIENGVLDEIKKVVINVKDLIVDALSNSSSEEGE